MASGGQQRLDWYLVPGVPTTLVLDTADGSDWPTPPRVLIGPVETDGDITPVVPEIAATIDPVTASRALAVIDDADMAAILTAYPLTARTACPWHVRLGVGEAEDAVSTGHLIWDATGRKVTASATLIVGPMGESLIFTEDGTGGLTITAGVSTTLTEDGSGGLEVTIS